MASTGRMAPPRNLHEPLEANQSEPSIFFNRELSWLEFNRRVLEEAITPDAHPLLERAKFISIFSSNLDEFFMIRVAGIEHQYEAGLQKRTVDGFTPAEQLERIRSVVFRQLQRRNDSLYGDILPALERQGIRLLAFHELPDHEQQCLNRHFREAIFPVLTPLAFDTSHPFPFMSNLSLNLAIELKDRQTGGKRLARVKVPGSLPRLVRLDDVGDLSPESGDIRFIWLEDLIANNLGELFPDMTVLQSHLFRVIRDADIDIEEDEAGDLLQMIEKGVRSRRYGKVVRLDISPGMPSGLKRLLAAHLDVSERMIYELDGKPGLSCLMELLKTEKPELKDEPHIPHNPVGREWGNDIFDAIRSRDRLLYHPYDSFQPIVDFIDRASTDPAVLSIKQTLYRVGSNSPIVSALIRAAELGKQVAVLVELKARFDEENNIIWAKALEDVGAHVIYGLPGLKTHAKLTMVVRREGDRLKRYLHLGTGNYNPSTGKLYTDYSLFTTNAAIAEEVSELFNALTGYSRYAAYRHLLVSPINTRDRLISMIEREAAGKQRGEDARIIMKMNSLVDARTIRALYKASCLGVPIDLIVRGICCLRPGVAGLSENIRVVSIVGRFLEHSRAYYFANGTTPELYLGSADIMPRNLDERVETLFPILDPELVRHIRSDLELQLADNVKAWRIEADGGSRKIMTEGAAVNSQLLLMHQASLHQKRHGIKRG